MGAQVGEALAYAHDQGVLHRDIKPSNLLLDAHGVVWVTDFGLAKASDGGDLTGTGEVVGTLRYIPPERFGGASDARGDVYSLGLTLYEMLTLRPAFDTEDRVRLIEHILHHAPPVPRRVNPDVPRDLETVVLKTIERDPDRRYQTATALADDLRRFSEDRPVLARPIGAGERLGRWCRRNPALAAALGTAGVLLLAVLATLTAGLAVAMCYAAEAGRQEQAAVASAAAERAEKQLTQRLLYAARMNLAQTALREYRPQALHHLLAEMRPAEGETDLRGFEWHYLWRQVHSAARTVSLRGSSAHPLDRPLRQQWFFSQDGSRLALVAPAADDSADRQSPAGTLEVFDAATGRVIGTTSLTLSGHRCFAFSPTGGRAAWATHDKKVVVWDVEAGREFAAFPVRREAKALAFDPQTTRLALREGGGWDPLPLRPRGPGATREPDEIHVWDLATRRETTSWQAAASEGGPHRLLFSADGRGLFFQVNDEGGGAGPMLRKPLLVLRDLDGGAERLRLDPQGGTPPAYGLSPDGRRLAVGHQHTVRLWDLDSGQESPLKITVPYFPRCMAFSPDGGSLAANVDYPAVTVWDARTGGERCVLRNSSVLGGLSFSRDGGRLLTVGQGGLQNLSAGEGKLWDAETGQELLTLSFARAAWEAGGLHFDGRRILTLVGSGLAPDKAGLRVIDGGPLEP